MIRLKPLSCNLSTVLWLGEEVSKLLKIKTTVLDSSEMPRSCYNSKRGQYNSTCILRFLEPIPITLAVTEKDLYTNGFNFVFGEAELKGARAVVSYFRLKSPPEKLRERLLKETIHELGHVFGLKHCNVKGCVMNFSNCVEDVDKKSPFFCDSCRRKL